VSHVVIPFIFIDLHFGAIVMQRPICLATVALVLLTALEPHTSGGGDMPKGVEARPSAVATALEAEGYVSIPLHRGKKTNWWYVNVLIEEQPMRLMVDSGASTSVLDRTAAARINIMASGKARTNKLLDNAPAFEHFQKAWPKMAVGSLDVPASPISVAKMHGFTMSTALDGDTMCDGLLGASFLHAYSAVLDYSAGRLYLLDPLKKEADLQGVWACTSFDDGREVRTDGGVRELRLTIRDGTATIAGGRFDHEFRIALDPSASPKRISLIHTKSGEVHGIYKLDGGRLTLAGPFFTASKRDYPPADFRSTVDGDVTVVTFEKK
jgi:uncharacterized protein (TIGR03067 family)